jgi:hypothetical protein
VKRHFAGQQHTPACEECNVTLGSKLFVTVETRAAYLLGALSAKYKKLLKGPMWSEDELEELGSSLRMHVEAVQAKACFVRTRLEHLRCVSAQDDRFDDDED